MKIFSGLTILLCVGFSPLFGSQQSEAEGPKPLSEEEQLMVIQKMGIPEVDTITIDTQQIAEPAVSEEM